jgi:hypothetical protein
LKILEVRFKLQTMSFSKFFIVLLPIKMPSKKLKKSKNWPSHQITQPLATFAISLDPVNFRSKTFKKNWRENFTLRTLVFTPREHWNPEKL